MIYRESDVAVGVAYLDVGVAYLDVGVAILTDIPAGGTFIGVTRFLAVMQSAGKLTPAWLAANMLLYLVWDGGVKFNIKKLKVWFGRCWVVCS